MRLRLKDWRLYELEPREESCPREREAEPVFTDSVTAAEALMAAGKLSDSILEDGEAAYCAWVAERDWLFTTRFPRPVGERVYLVFEGLDTDCDLWLNGEKIASHHSLYLPLRLDVTERLEEENELAVYFYSPIRLMERRAAAMPEEWKGVVRPHALMRKPPCDFYNNYLGVTPYFTPVGFCGDVLLETAGTARVAESRWEYELNSTRTGADLEASVSALGTAGETVTARFTLTAPEGTVVLDESRPLTLTGWDTPVTETLGLTLDAPELWYPRGFGGQPLYEAAVWLERDGAVLSRETRRIGFRTVELVGDLLFRINGRVVRLWGGNLATLGSISHRPHEDKIRFLLERAVRCNFNALRVWGPGDLPPDLFYEEADRLGLLIWQDFSLEPSQLPDTEEFRALLLREATHLIKRLRHHPGLLLWCGSNESLHMMDFNGETARIGTERLLRRDLPKLVLELDPARYYHISCPCGGAFANDPLHGDTHGSHCMMSFLPGEEFPVFVSEHIQTFPPEYKSLRRFVPEEEIWPEGWSDLAVFGKQVPYPPALARRTNNFCEHKLGPLERYYDATDGESLVYKLTAAAGYAYYHLITRLRRGKPHYDAAGARRCSGYLSWKYNNTWPQFYCGLVDYYGECHIPYYDTRRALAPVLLNFEVGDQVWLWGVNDTGADVSGELRVKVFRMTENRVVKAFSVPAALPAGESRILTDLSRLGHFRKDCVLYAELREGDEVLAAAHELLDLERRLPFPAAKLTVSAEGDALVITTDAYAHCVELSGETEEGDAFGWFFEDNYFDLLPFETRRVRVGGRHTAGTLTARAHYSPHAAHLRWEKGEK